jgi:cell wall-associated NlpC family hydrolase
VLIPTAIATLTQPPTAAAIIAEPPATVALQPRDFPLVRPVHTQIQSQPAKTTVAPAKVAKRAARKAPKKRARREAQPAPDIAATGDRSGVLKFALSQVGKPYRRGGTGNGGWDCSGLVSAAYRSAGVSLPHSSGAIGREGRAVAAGQWRPGDVIASRGHVALYLGNGLMVEAANPNDGVRVTRVRPGTARRF